MDDYFAAKSQLFRSGRAAAAWAVLNRDDSYARRSSSSRPPQVLLYGTAPTPTCAPANLVRFQACDSTCSRARRGSEWSRPDRAHQRVQHSGGVRRRTVVRNSAPRRSRADRATAAVPGAFERVDEGQPFVVVVDYAHTDDALRNVIAVARGLNRSG
jgi:UDP-N-acetylmuramoyl-L-alanyl-D-glutamate--2,6-diaminopimelate ligase